MKVDWTWTWKAELPPNKIDLQDPNEDPSNSYGYVTWKKKEDCHYEVEGYVDGFLVFLRVCNQEDSIIGLVRKAQETVEEVRQNKQNYCLVRRSKIKRLQEIPSFED